jgi:hypothetical protein
MVGLSVLVLSAVVRTLTVQADGRAGDAPVVICPVGAATIIVPPELGAIAVSGGGREIGAKVKGGRLVVSPVRHPASAVVEFRGSSGLRLRIRLRAVAEGEGLEIHIRVAPAGSSPNEASAERPRSRSGSRRSVAPADRPDPAPSPSPATPERTAGTHASLPPALAPSPAPPSAPSTEPSPSPAVPASPGATTSREAHAGMLPSRTLDIEELLTLRPEEIGRREGLPGELPVVLEDALKGPRNVWLRFRVEGGARHALKKVEWEHGEVKDVLASPEGKDLRIIVRLPRGEVTRRTRVTIRLSDGASYKFALSAPWFSTFVKGLLF